MFNNTRISIIIFMKTSTKSILQTVLFGGIIGLYGCEKLTTSELKPVASQTRGQNPTATSTPSAEAQSAWLRVLDKIERGELTDPNGQYVSKGSQVAISKSGTRLQRPKFDASSANYPAWYGEQVAKEQAATLKKGTASRILPDPCPNGDCGGLPPPAPTVYTTFVSSEGVAPYTGSDNPNGYIWDLKIVKGSTSSEQPLAGYTKIDADLNRGAGGSYIYLTFTRSPFQTRLGDETGYGWTQSQISGPVRGLQALTQPTGISVGWIWGATPPPGFVPIWSPNPIPGSTWKQPDLNDGAGGSWIYGFQFKEYQSGPVEVGIISSTSSRPVPPANWTADYTQDLNEGAGGAYIYFCTKNR